MIVVGNYKNIYYLCRTHSRTNIYMPNTPRSYKPNWVMTSQTDKRAKPQNVILVNGVPFYQTMRHRNISKKHRREHPYCHECNKNNIVTLGTVMDHVIPINAGGAKYDPANRRTLCDKCHNQKRGRESHGQIESWVMNEEGDKIPHP